MRTPSSQTLSVLVGLAVLGSVCRAAPTIPKERIPANCPGDVRRFIEQMYSRDHVTRAMGAVHLGRMGDLAEPGIPFLIAMLGDDVRLEWEARDTDSPLEEAKKRLMGLTKDRETSPGHEAAQALANLCAAAPQPLIAALGDPSAAVRVNAAFALGGIKDTVAVDDLLPLLKDPAIEVRCEAARSLGRLGDTKATEPLIAALKDTDRHVRTDIVTALGELRDPRTLPPLLDALGDVIDVRTAAEKALLDTRDPRAVEPLITELKDRNRDVRCIAARLLGAIGDRRAVRPLILALKDRESSVRFEAAGSLRRMSGEDYGADTGLWQRWWELAQAEEAVEAKVAGDPAHAYIAALRDPSWAVRAYGARQLGETRDTRAVRPLCGLLWDRDATVRQAAAIALGEVGDPRAVEALIAAVADADSRVQEAAGYSLRYITRASFGNDTKQWQEWWDANKDEVFERHKREVRQREHEATTVRAEKEEAPESREKTSGTALLIILALVAVFPIAIMVVLAIMRER